MWELDHKEGWAPKNECFQIVVLEKTLESRLDSMEIKPVNPKENWPWILIGRTDSEAPVLWPPDGKSQLIGKDPDAGKDWGQEEKGVTELYGITDSVDINLSNHWEIVKGRGTWCAVVQLQSWTWLSDWTTITLRKKTEVERANEFSFCFLSSLKLRFLQFATGSDLMSTLRNSSLLILWYLRQVWNSFV